MATTFDLYQAKTQRVRATDPAILNLVVEGSDVRRMVTAEYPRARPYRGAVAHLAPANMARPGR